MEAPGGEPGHPHTGWAIEFMGPEQVRCKTEEALEAESLLLGRVTYESFAGAWPERTGALADQLNAMPKHVVSTTLQGPLWKGSQVIATDVVAEIGRLRQRDGGPILVNGSRTLVHTLMAHDLVDELRLMIFPVAVGGGGRLFPETQRKQGLQLAGTHTFDNGTVVLTYRPSRAQENSQ
jgi:dihydrofolate reductase